MLALTSDIVGFDILGFPLTLVTVGRYTSAGVGEREHIEIEPDGEDGKGLRREEMGIMLGGSKGPRATPEAGRAVKKVGESTGRIFMAADCYETATYHDSQGRSQLEKENLVRFMPSTDGFLRQSH